MKARTAVLCDPNTADLVIARRRMTIDAPQLLNLDRHPPVRRKGGCRTLSEG
jgi:hypothetical protein